MSNKPSKAQLNTISMYKAKGIYSGAVKAFEKKYGAAEESVEKVEKKVEKKVTKKVSKKKVSKKS